MRLSDPEKFELSVGMDVFLIPAGNARYYHGNQQFIKGTVTKIAKKYFYVFILLLNSVKSVKFNIKDFDSHCEGCNAGYLIFNSERSLREFKEAETMTDKIRAYVDSFVDSFAIQTSPSFIRKIYQVIKEEYEKYDENNDG